jgi:hypothetical protein
MSNKICCRASYETALLALHSFTALGPDQRERSPSKATGSPYCIAMNPVDVAAFIANDDAQHEVEMAAVALIVGATIMLHAVERKKRTRRAHGGSLPGRKPNRDLGMKEAGILLDRQYFCRTRNAIPIFSDAEFERRFRMPRETYETIRTAVLKHNPDNFEQRPDATGRLGASTDQKVTAALRMMCYGAPADQLVEIVGMPESLIMECLPLYCHAVVESLGGRYLRAPTAEELAEIESRFAELGFPGCVGALTVPRGSGTHVQWRGLGCSRVRTERNASGSRSYVTTSSTYGT